MQSTRGTVLLVLGPTSTTRRPNDALFAVIQSVVDRLRTISRKLKRDLRAFSQEEGNTLLRSLVTSIDQVDEKTDILVAAVWKELEDSHFDGVVTVETMVQKTDVRVGFLERSIKTTRLATS